MYFSIKVNITVIKTEDLLHQIVGFSKDYLLILNEINTKLWKFGIEFVYKLLLCVRYLVFRNFQTNFIVYWLCYLMSSRYALYLRPLETPSDINKLNFDFKAKTVCTFGGAGINIPWKPENGPILSPLSAHFRE